MKPRTYLSLLSWLLLCFGFQSSGFAQDKVIEIKANVWHPPTQRLTTDCYKWAGKEIEQRTKGKVKFTWFVGGTMANEAKTHDAVVTGMVDLGITVANFAVMHLYPISSVFGLPFIVDSAVHAADMGNEMYQTIPELRQEYSKTKFLGITCSAVSNLHTVRPAPKTLEELKNLKILVFHAQMTDAQKALGGIPQFMKAADFYTAIQRGMADGCWFPDAPLRSWRFTELMQNHTMANLCGSPQSIQMNINTWNKLPPDVKKVFEDLGPSIARLHAHTLVNESDWVIQELKDRGDKFYYLPPDEKAKWIDKVKPLYAAYIEDLNKKGWNGGAIFEKVLAIAEKYRKNPLPPDSWWGRAGRKTGEGFVSVEQKK